MKRILIMEDNVSLAMEWRDVFALNNYDVTLTQDGDEAAEYLDAESFDLVVTDLFVKGARGGLHVIVKLRRMGAKAPPVIAVTGATGSAVRETETNLFLEQAKSLGASSAIQKPFGAVELVILAQSLIVETADDVPSSADVSMGKVSRQRS